MASLCLVAGAAEAQSNARERQRVQQEQQAQCEEQCTQAVEEKAQKCMEHCPLPRGGNTKDFEACSQGCMREAAASDCSRQCVPVTKGTKSGARK
jgi:hypothetical protein